MTSQSPHFVGARPPGPVAVLQLTLHNAVLGHLVQAGQATALVFDPAWVASNHRPAFTLCGTHAHPASANLFDRPWLRADGLHPVLANLLPESGLRAGMAALVCVPADDDFALLAALGADLPGALQVQALAPAAIPPGVLDFNASAVTLALPATTAQPVFALAGSQHKLLLHEDNGAFSVADRQHPGTWILKLPSRDLGGLPQNEYTASRLAQMAGVEVPALRLLRLGDLPLPPALHTNPDEFGLAIQRFDRSARGDRIHAEDFAQVLFKTPAEKYSAACATALGQVVHGYTHSALANTQQLARRLLVNVLLGNGDAHLKNWSLVYPDKVHAELAPAYDLLCTQTVLPQDRQQPWAIGGCRDWYSLDFSHFAEWGRAVGVPWRVLRPQLLDTVERARTLWPQALEAAPMLETHKLLLRHHWKNLQKKLQYGL